MILFISYVEVLDFHHINPKEKDPKAGSMWMWSRQRLKKELDKCILVCANCHREEHIKMKKNV